MRADAALLAVSLLAAGPCLAGTPFSFDSIDGGTIDLGAWRGSPVLVANTASLCAFTPQYDDLQALYDRYRDRGLVVLAVPSDDFRQELDSAEEVKEFCEVNFDLDLPMADITPVRGPEAHPFFRWLAEEHGFVPAWNFAKVLIGPEGEVLGTWQPATRPTAPEVVELIEPLLR